MYIDIYHSGSVCDDATTHKMLRNSFSLF